MLKVGGIDVSPFEVEARLMTHSAVLEVAAIGVAEDTFAALASVSAG